MMLLSTNFIEKKISDIELAGSEKPDDIMIIECVGFTSGVNLNGAIIEKAEAKKSAKTLIGKPIRILFDGLNPTGHGLSVDGKSFSKDVSNIGYVHNVEISESKENDEDYKAIVQAIVWKKYVPEIAERLVELFKDEKLNFSVELERDVEISEDGFRKCKNLNFRGLTIVKSPAWVQSKAIMVAEDNSKGEGEEDMDEDKIKKEEDKKEEDNYKEKYVNLKAEFISLKSENETLTKERDEYIQLIEQVENEKIGKERLEKLSKYGETESSIEEISKLSQEEFLSVLIEKMETYTEKAKDKKEEDKKDDKKSKDPMSGYFEDVNKDKEDTSEKESLYNLLQGISE